ncbi:MAG: glycosyltransferase family 2 protein [Gammaproteobacteria bacterium]|nr:glycosyltransferase family 2 protein [Gammaproteobacteria bacterium]
MKRKLLSIVVPVFNEGQVIDAFYDRIKKVLDTLDSMSYEIVFVDDGSTDDSYAKLISVAHVDGNVKVLKLSRNFGHQIAITAGIDYATGDAVVVIDADLQDPPELIRALVGKWEEGHDVVYSVREKRQGEGKMKLLTATLFYRVLKAFARIDIPVDVGDFRLMSKRAVTQFKELREKDRFVRGLVSWMGFKQAGVPYVRERRYAGETKYPYRKMMKFAFDGITSFSTVPLKLATWLGYGASLGAFLYGCSVFVQKALGYTVEGWATIMVGMLFLGGVQLICLGLVGEYVGRIFNEVKGRPLYVIEELYDKTAAMGEVVTELPYAVERNAEGIGRELEV